jgi:hypothetical protein
MQSYLLEVALRMSPLEEGEEKMSSLELGTELS